MQRFFPKQVRKMRYVRHTETFAAFPQFGPLKTTALRSSFPITFRNRRCHLLDRVDNTLQRVILVHSSRELGALNSTYCPVTDRQGLPKRLAAEFPPRFSPHAVPYSAPLRELGALKRVFRAKEQTVG